MQYSTKKLHHDIDVINDRIKRKDNNPYNLTRHQSIEIQWQNNPKALGDEIVVYADDEKIIINPINPFKIYQGILQQTVDSGLLIKDLQRAFEKYQGWLFSHQNAILH